MRFVKVCGSCGHESKFPLTAMYSEQFVGVCSNCGKMTTMRVEKRNDKEQK